MANQVDQAERARQLLGQAYRYLGIFHFPESSGRDRDMALSSALISAEQAVETIREIRANRRYLHKLSA